MSTTTKPIDELNPRVFIEGVPGYDGEYPYDLRPTMREQRLIKRVSGAYADAVLRGIIAGDPDVMLAVAIVALHRAGHRYADDFERAIDDVADFKLILVIDADSETGDDADPPTRRGSSAAANGRPSAKKPNSGRTSRA